MGIDTERATKQRHTRALLSISWDVPPEGEPLPRRKSEKEAAAPTSLRGSGNENLEALLPGASNDESAEQSLQPPQQRSATNASEKIMDLHASYRLVISLPLSYSLARSSIGTAIYIYIARRGEKCKFGSSGEGRV